MNRLINSILLVSLCVLVACGEGSSSRKPTGQREFDGEFFAPAIDKSHIQNCLEDQANNVKVRVNRDGQNSCGPIIGGEYTLEKAAGRIRLDLGKIYFSYWNKKGDLDPESNNPPNDSDYQLAKGKVQAAKQCLIDFFDKHRIALQVEFVFDQEYIDRSYHQKVIRLSNGVKRSDSKNWFLGSEPNVCGLAIHELGHWLGLPDRYSDTDKCANRNTLLNNLNIMNTFDAAPLEEITFADADLKAIISPLCDFRAQDYHFTKKGIFYLNDVYFDRDTYKDFELSDLSSPSQYIRYRLRKSSIKTGMTFYGCFEREVSSPLECFSQLERIEALVQGQQFVPAKNQVFFLTSLQSGKRVEYIQDHAVLGQGYSSITQNFARQCASRYHLYPKFPHGCTSYATIGLKDSNSQMIDKMKTNRREVLKMRSEANQSLSSVLSIKNTFARASQKLGLPIVCDEWRSDCLQTLANLQSALETVAIDSRVANLFLLPRKDLAGHQNHWLCRDTIIGSQMTDQFILLGNRDLPWLNHSDCSPVTLIGLGDSVDTIRNRIQNPEKIRDFYQGTELAQNLFQLSWK